MTRHINLMLIALLAVSPVAQADCRRDRITCTERCELPGLTGALAKQRETAFRDCATRCEQAQTQCLALQEQERRYEQDDLLRPQPEGERADGSARQRLDAESARIAAVLRERYPGKLALATISVEEGKVIPKTPSEFRRTVSLGDYDPANGRLNIGIDGVRYNVGVAFEDARRFKGVTEGTLSGTAMPLAPGVIELREARLSAKGVSPVGIRP